MAHGEQGLPAGAPPPVRLATAPTYWRCEPSWSWRARPLTDHLLWYVLDGVGWLHVAGEEHDLAAGVGAVFAPGDQPTAGHDPRRPLLVFGMHFDIEPAAVPAGMALPVRPCAAHDPGLVAVLARHCDRTYRRGDVLGARQAELCLLQLVCLLGDAAARAPAPPGDAALEELTRLVRQEPSRRWTVSELAGQASLSRAQLSRRFVAHTGMSPARYVAQARIERARQLLTETTMTVSQVASTLGYTDLGHFSRQFKRHTGQAPSRLRPALARR